MKALYSRQVWWFVIFLLLWGTSEISQAAPSSQKSESCQTLNEEGNDFKDQGQYAEAFQKYQAALTCSKGAEDRSTEAIVLYNIGYLYINQGSYVEALEMFEQALVILRDAIDRTVEGASLNGIGEVYSNQGRHTEALEMFRQALAIIHQVDRPILDGTILINIGDEYRYQGNYVKALESFEQALTIARNIGDRTTLEGVTLNSIGMVYRAQGRNAEALKLYQQALAIVRELDSRASQVTILGNIGELHKAEGRYIEALEMFQQALSIAQEVHDRTGEGRILAHRGGVYANQGRYREALEVLQEARVILKEVGDRTGEGFTLNAIGTVYTNQRRNAEAFEMYQQALIIMQEMGDWAGEGIILNNMGKTLQDQERYTEALKVYQQAMDTIEAIRITAGSEQGRAAFIAQYVDLYTRAAGLFYNQSQDEEAFFTSERGRARVFLDSLATGHVELTDPLVQDQGIPATMVKAQDDQLANPLPVRNIVLKLSEGQTLLDEQTTLLSYFILDNQTLIFLITHDNFEVFEIKVSRQELNHRVGFFRDVISKRQPKAVQPVAQELYQLLIAPLATSLSKPRLAIIPHGALHYLPFAALVDPDTDQHLLEQHEVVILPSATALSFIQANAATTGGNLGNPLVLGNPTTADYDATASLAFQRGSLGSLPFAEKEAQAIAALYGVEPLLGPDATEAEVRERVARAGILHLAAHGRYNPTAPLSSLIALAPGGGDNGWLTVGEIYGLDLSQTDLVVLSACQTQLGDLSAGDELVGLTRAFFFAGTPTVIASLWNVDDQATSLLMERFYTHLKGGMVKAAALRQAQLEMIKDYPDPYYWAGFVLSGDGGG